MRLYASFLSFSLFLIPALVAAEEEKKDSDAEARAAFDEAKALYTEGNYDKAAEMFRAAYKLRPTWKLLFNIAQSEAAAKRPGLALESFEAYLSRGGDDIPTSRKELVLSEIKRLRPIVGFVTLSPSPAGAQVIIDNILRGELPLSGPLMLAAGYEHSIKIELDGAVITERIVKVAGEQTIHIEIEDTSPKEEPKGAVTEPQDKAATPAPAADTAGKKSSKKRTLGIVGISAGAGLLVAGAVTGALALSKYGYLKDTCKDGCIEQSDKDKIGQADNFALVTDILLPTGAVFGTVGIILLVLSRKDRGIADSTHLNLRPVVGPTQGGFLIEGKF